MHNTLIRVNAAATKMATAVIEFILHYGWKRVVMVTLMDGVCGLGAVGIKNNLKVLNTIPISSPYSLHRENVIGRLSKMATAVIEFILHYGWKRVVMVTLMDGVCGLGAVGIKNDLKVPYN